MRIAVMQPYLFPYVGYFQLIAAVDRFVVLDDVRFIRRGWIHRNRILLGGREWRFTVPVEGASQNRDIRDVTVVPQAAWLAKLLRTLEHAYRKAPEFERVWPCVRGVLSSGERSISRLAVLGLVRVCEVLAIGTELVESSSVYGNGQLRGEERILDICARERASHYVNLPGGAELYSEEAFAARGIALEFLRPEPGGYRQLGGPFVPWLSIIDVLMFNSGDEARRLVLRERVAA